MKFSTNSFKIWAWADISSEAAALSSAVAEFIWTTMEICSIPDKICVIATSWLCTAEEIPLI